MYEKIFTINFFNIMQPHNLNLIKIKVVELEKLYLCSKDHFQIYCLGFEKISK